MARSEADVFPLRIVDVDLESQRYSQRAIEPEIHRKFIGGSTLAAWLLFDQIVPELDPLGPHAPLAFVTGPLTGTLGPAVGRAVVCAKSPATRAWGESNIGGHLGPQLRFAGFDGLILHGRAQAPTYLWVHDGKIDFLAASHLWGTLDTYATQDVIREDLGIPGVHVACIGLAGESLLRSAGILCDHGRVAGRTGMGAVMGSKNLKAIAVYGREPTPVEQPKQFSALRSQVNKELRQDIVSSGLRDFGTGGASDIFDYFGMMPKQYYSKGTLTDADRVSGPSMHETILSGVSTCHGCVIACGRRVRLDDGAERKGPEYETIIGFGPNLGSTDLSAITRLGELCDSYGMDTISVSNTIGLAFLLYERGILDEAQCGGSLVWGDTSAAERLIHLMIRREGLGELLAQGSLALAQACGVPELAAHVKGLETPYHDPRGGTGVALSYATSPRGACHNQSHYYMVEIGQTMEDIGVMRFERQAGAEKAANVARHQDWLTVLNALVACIFANVDQETMCEMLNQVTGWRYAPQELMLAGERGWTLKRLINNRLGFSNQEDCLPEHLNQPLGEGGAAGFTIPFAEMLSAYYAVRGWEADTGRPGRSLLKRLDLEGI